MSVDNISIGVIRSICRKCKELYDVSTVKVCMGDYTEDTTVPNNKTLQVIGIFNTAGQYLQGLWSRGKALRSQL